MKQTPGQQVINRLAKRWEKAGKQALSACLDANLSDGVAAAAQTVMSVLPPKAGIRGATRDVRFGPKAKKMAAHSITSSAREKERRRHHKTALEHHKHGSHHHAEAG